MNTSGTAVSGESVTTGCAGSFNASSRRVISASYLAASPLRIERAALGPLRFCTP